MRRLLRWIAVLVGVAALMGGGLALWVYQASEAHMRSFARPPGSPPFTHAIPNDAASIARGEHLLRTRGCAGCHGEQLQGQLMWGFAVAPNLVALARKESPATLETAIRHGIGHDGRAFFSMPSFNFMLMSDADLADLIAYLRQAPLAPTPELPAASLPWKIRWDLATGADGAMPRWLPQVPPLRLLQQSDDPRLRRGEYIAMTACIECHGFTLKADFPWVDEDHAPNLRVIIGAYDEAAFRHLMKTGKAAGERELRMMSAVARGRYAHFTDEEVGDLYAYLRSPEPKSAPASP